jgi:hypothetical protein
MNCSLSAFGGFYSIFLVFVEGLVCKLKPLLLLS